VEIEEIKTAINEASEGLKKGTKEAQDNATKALADAKAALEALELKANATELKELKDAFEKEKEEMQKEFDALSAKLKTIQAIPGSPVEGSVVKMFKERIENKSYNQSKFYEKHEVKGTDFVKEFVTKLPATMTTANVLPNVAGGFSPLFGNYIDTEIGQVPLPQNIMLPLVTVKNEPGTESIWYTDRINEEGDAEFIGEGDLKPLADADWQTYKAPITEVALRWKFSRRLQYHAPAVIDDFQVHARELVDQAIDTGILEGDGTGDALNGIQNQAAAFTVPAELADFYYMPNIYDAIMAMATAVRLANFRGQLTAVLNTVWEAKMMGYKDTLGQYIIPPFVTRDGTRVGSVNIVFSNKIDDGDILIGELKRFNVVFAENVMYEEGYENDDFSKNLVSRKLEAFLGTYIKGTAAGSILFDTIASVLEDIGQPTT
jgi:HK97 family phage major capsid protein